MPDDFFLSCSNSGLIVHISSAAITSYNKLHPSAVWRVLTYNWIIRIWIMFSFMYKKFKMYYKMHIFIVFHGICACMRVCGQCPISIFIYIYCWLKQLTDVIIWQREWCIFLWDVKYLYFMRDQTRLARYIWKKQL